MRWDSVHNPTGLVDMVHAGWVQRLLRAEARYGVAQDGVLDGPSLTIQKLQAELNAVSGYGD